MSGTKIDDKIKEELKSWLFLRGVPYDGRLVVTYSDFNFILSVKQDLFLSAGDLIPRYMGYELWADIDIEDKTENEDDFNQNLY